MKKITVLLLIFAMLLSLVGCNKPDQGGIVTPDEPSPEVKGYLVENEDYIDLTSGYRGDGIPYNDSLWYVNELDEVPLPDPHVYFEDGKYYIVGTNDRDINTVDCYVTEDFVNYTVHNDIFKPSLYGGWENSQAEVYAPEIYLFGGVYYMYYSADDKDGVRRCSVAQADNPLGPYEPLVNSEVDGLNNPLFYNSEHPERNLDTTIFTDDNGRMYMYYVARRDVQFIAGVEMINPYTADWSTYRELVKPGTPDSDSEEVTLEWEVCRSSKLKIAEAPYMLKSGGKYYLTYSVNGCWNSYYNVCYAVSDSPLGNFVKPYEEGKTWTNLLLGFPGDNDEENKVNSQWQGFASGTGHHCFFYVGDELMIGYHAHQNRNWNSTDFTPRYFAFDYVYFDDNGVPFCNGPSYSVINLPAAISGWGNIAAGANISGTNVQGVENANDNYIVDCYNLDSKDREVRLSAGESSIEIRFDKSYEILGVLVYNSAYYEDYIIEIEYIDFGDGNLVYYPQFCEDFYVQQDTEFIYPLSCFNIEFIKSFSADSVKIGFNLPEGGSINEIVILGK